MDPLVLVPGLLCTEALFAPQIGELAREGVRIQVADHRQDETVAAITTRLLAEAPRVGVRGEGRSGSVAAVRCARG